VPERAERVHLLVLAKAPVAGRVKTRLCPPFTPAEAAQLAEAALRDTLAAVAQTPAVARTAVLEGQPGAWLPPSFTVLPQRGGGLDERLAAAFDDAWAQTDAPLLLVGMDTPQLTAALLTAAVDQLLSAGTDAVLGLAADGGWWALGLRRPDASLLLGVPMSTDTTGAAQRARLADAGLRVALLPVLIDVDDAEDARTVAAQCPATRFAEVHRALVGTATGAGTDLVEQVRA
jgi:rSAM/selenodomain-associated transferase 1